MMEGFLLQVSLSCPGCHGKVHLQGLVTETTCPACASPFQLPEDQWLSWFEGMLGQALANPSGQASMTELGGSHTSCSLTVQSPRCSACGVDLPLNTLEQRAAQGHVPCACGQTTSLRRAPEWVGTLIPGARWLLDEGSLSGGAAPATAAPIVLNCMTCAGSLPVDGSTRAVSCQYCGASNFLPDAVWLRLHPPQKVRPFSVVAEWDAHTRVSVLADYDPEGVAAQPDLPTAVLLKLAASDDWTARRNVARHQDLPAEAMQRLARDPDSDVREALAQNPSIPPDVQATLARDQDSDVRTLIAANPATDPAVLRTLCQDDSYRVRQATVANPRLPAEALLPWLALEDDSDVQDAAIRRDDLPVELLRNWLLAGSWDRRRTLVARYPGTPPELLQQLARDDYDEVLRALLHRQDLDARTILTLASASDPKVAELARMHAAYAPAARSRLKRRLLMAAILLLVLACAGSVAGGIGAVVLVIQQLGLL